MTQNNNNTVRQMETQKQGELTHLLSNSGPGFYMRTLKSKKQKHDRPH